MKEEHQLKVWKEFLPDIMSETKTFEIRKNDRNFKEDEILILVGWDNEKQEYTKGLVRAQIKYILHGGQFGLQEGYVCMAIKVLYSNGIIN